MRGTATTTAHDPHTVALLAQEPHAISFLWPLGAIASVLYLSLLPLNINWAAITTSSTFGIARLAFHTPTREDLITNLTVYVPVGFFLAACTLDRGVNRFRGVVLAVVIGASLSVAAEVLQTGLAERVASWWDVLLNTTGAVIGAAMAFVWHGRAGTAAARWHRASWTQRFRTAAALLTVGLFAYHLAPFDFVTSTDALHGAFRRAQISLWHGRSLDTAQAPFAAIVHELGSAMFFAILTFVVALGQRRRGARAVSSLASAMVYGIATAGAIEVLQLFTVSHVFDIASFMLRSLAAATGAWAGVFLFANVTSDNRSEGTHTGFYRVGLGLALMVQVALLCGGVDWSFLSHGSWTNATGAVIPMEALWRAPMRLAVTDMAATIITYGSLAMTLALVLLQTERRHALSLACFGASSVSLLMAALSSVSRSTPFDITKPLLATIAAFAVVEFLRNVQPESVKARRR